MNITKKRIIILVVTIIAFLFIRWVFSLAGSGGLEVSAPLDIPDNASVQVTVSGEALKEDVVFTLAPGASKHLRLPKGNVQVQGVAGVLRAIDVVEISGFHTAKVSTPSGQQKKIQQTASNVSSCLVAIKNIVYSYACGGQTPILKHELTATHQSINSILFGGQEFDFLSPYYNGMLSFTGDTSALSYIDIINGTITPVTLPQTISSLEAGFQPQLITSGNPKDSHFVLVAQSINKIYLFKNTSDASPIEINLGDDLKISDNKHLIKGSFSDNTLTIFAGRVFDIDGGEGEGTAPVAGSIPAEPAPESDIDGCVFDYDLTGKLKRQITLPKNLEAESLARVAGDFYVANMSGAATFYYYDGKRLEKKYSFTDVGTWINIDGRAYIQSDRSLYEFRPGKGGLFGLHSLFTSNSIFVSMLFTGDDGVVFSGFTGSGSQQTLNGYKLSDEDADLTLPQQVEPDYLNFEDFIDLGVTADQVDNLKNALGQYANSVPLTLTSVSVRSLEATIHDRYNPDIQDSISFVVSFNKRTAITAKVDLFEATGIRLYLYDSDGKQIFDSGLINHQNVAL